MQVSPQIKKAFESLLTQQIFISNIEEYTRSALCTIFNQPQHEEIDCPPSYIFIINHVLQNNASIDPFLSSLPENTRRTVSNLVQDSKTQNQELRLDNTFYNNLSDVRWRLIIENSREIFEVELFTSEREQPFKMRLNYEQLSILTFQLTQAVTRLAHFADLKQ